MSSFSKDPAGIRGRNSDVELLTNYMERQSVSQSNTEYDPITFGKHDSDVKPPLGSFPSLSKVAHTSEIPAFTADDFRLETPLSPAFNPGHKTRPKHKQSTSIQLDPHPPPKQLAEVGDRKGSSGHEHDPGLIKIVDPDKVCKRPFYGKDSFVLSFVKSLCSFCYCCHRNTAQLGKDPPHRWLYLGKQKQDSYIDESRRGNDYEHIRSGEGGYERRPPRTDDSITPDFPSNRIRTTKYTPLSFLPLSLFEQIIRPINFFYLIVVIISFSKYASSSPIFNVTPLTFVLLVAIGKELVEDCKRYAMDKDLNNKPVEVWDGEKFVETKWKSLRVSDVIRITKNNAEIPADIVLLQTSEGKGIANIETSNLDGETNLKIKQAALATSTLKYGEKNGDDYCVNISIELESEAPNEKMTAKGWKGNIVVNEDYENQIPLTMNAMVLRGCSLRNTQWIIAMVVFTGVETKVMLNQKPSEFKASHLHNYMDRLISFIMLFLFSLIIIAVIGHAVFLHQSSADEWYDYILNGALNANGEAPDISSNDRLQYTFERIPVYFVLLSLMVPISIYITEEFAKLLQSQFINWDREMRYLNEEDIEYLKNAEPEIQVAQPSMCSKFLSCICCCCFSTPKANTVETEDMGVWAEVRTGSLNDEIGQITWVFSDKTGTLTRNIMEFKNCYVCCDTVSVKVKCDIDMSVSQYEDMKSKRIIEQRIAEVLKMDEDVSPAIGSRMIKDNVISLYIPCLRGRKFDDRRGEAKNIIQTLHKQEKIPVGGALLTNIHAEKIITRGGKKFGPGFAEKHGELFAQFPTPRGSPAYNHKELHFDDNRLVWEAHVDKRADMFLTALSVCHTTLPDTPKDPSKPLEFTYQAASPDDKALVVFAKNMHYFFVDIQAEQLQVGNERLEGSQMLVRINGEDVLFDVLDIIEFSSARKRQSTIVRDPRSGRIFVFTKGADNVILSRMRKDSVDAHWEECELALKGFARIGLRTLCVAYRELSQNEFLQWWHRLDEAKADIDHKDELVPQIEQEIETELVLLGATAIEDRLQDGVPDTIASLHFARLNVWVLTGDKVETAINIGRSCHLITDEMHTQDNSLIVIDIDEKLEDAEAKELTEKAMEKAWAHVQNHDDEKKQKQGLVLSGKALGFVFPIRKRDSMGKEIEPTKEEAKEEARMGEILLRICNKCSAVLCCRVSPKQKAQMVELVKLNVPGVVTLAIGDGANDVPMIHAAHVGVGIKGFEGVQAVMASDYAIGQFRYLQDLLFVHGAWNYRRLSTTLLYFFNKNIAIAMTQIWFSFYSGFSGTMYNDDMTPSCYNLAFTVFPPFMIAMFDRPYTREIAKLCPEIYQRDCFNLKIFFIYFAHGIFTSIIIFFGTVYVTDSWILPDGQTLGFAASFTTMVTALIIAVIIKAMMDTREWFHVTLASFTFSICSWFIFAVVYSMNPDALGSLQNFFTVSKQWRVRGTPGRLFETSIFWINAIFIGIASTIPEMCIRAYRREWGMTKEHLVQEIEKDPKAYNEFITKLREAKDKHISHDADDAKVSQFQGTGYAISAVDRDMVDLPSKSANIQRLRSKRGGISSNSYLQSEERAMSTRSIGSHTFKHDLAEDDDESINFTPVLPNSSMEAPENWDVEPARG